MRVALVHDFLNEFGGAERVLETLCEVFPNAPIYTAFYKKGSSAYLRFKNKRIITSWAQNVPFFASYLHSPLRFLAPWIWGSFDFSQYDLVITSASWYVTKGIAKRNTTKDERKTIEVCYCHTPPRYLYGYPTAKQQQGFFVKLYALVVNHFMRVYDFESAQKVDYFIANSKEVQARIKKFYRRDSVVIYPPVDVKKFQISLSTRNSLKASNFKFQISRDYFLVVSRLVAAKNVDVAVEVCTKLDLPLKVVGDGRERGRLEELAKKSVVNGQLSPIRQAQGDPEYVEGANVQFLGEVSDQELIKLYQNCRAVIYPAAQEDFGLVPVEAMAAGRPVIVNAEGGVLESVIDALPAGKGRGTGVYFDPPTPGSLTLAINNFMDLERKNYFDHNFIQHQARKFSKERFKKEILRFVKRKVK